MLPRRVRASRSCASNTRMNALVPLSNSSALLSSGASVPKDHEPTNCWNTSAPLHAQDRLPPQQLATLYSVYLVASVFGILGSVFVAWKTKRVPSPKRHAAGRRYLIM